MQKTAHAFVAISAIASLALSGCSSNTENPSTADQSAATVVGGTPESDSSATADTSIDTSTDLPCPNNRTPVSVVGIASITLLEFNYTEFSLVDQYYRFDTLQPVAANDLLFTVSSSITTSTNNPSSDAAIESFVSVPTDASSSCDAPTGFIVSVDEINDIVITSDQDWNDELPAGTSLNAIADALSITESSIPDDGFSMLQIEQVDQAYFPAPSNPDAQALPLSELAQAGNTAPIQLLVRLSPPDNSRTHRLNFTYSMRSGDTFTQTTEPITILKERANPQRLNGSLWNLTSYTLDGDTATIEPPERQLWHRLSVGRSALQIVVSIPELGFCEFNVDITQPLLEIRDEAVANENTDPALHTNQNCNFPEGESTTTQMALEQFFVPGQLRYEVSNRTLTLTSENGDAFVFESARF